MIDTNSQTDELQQASIASERRRVASRLLDTMRPSTYVKDIAVGGVAFVAIRITYIYLKALGQKPELLAAMGPKLIVDILGICIGGVLLNRGVDAISDLLTRFVDAFDSGVNRMADSSERTAVSAAASAACSQQHAAALAQMATSVQQLAAKDDRPMQQIEILISTLVMNSKRVLRKLHEHGEKLERLEDKAGVQRAETGDRATVGVTAGDQA